VVANDGAALAGLFTDDGVYEDGFFGAHQGRDEIIAMLARFHATGTGYRWDFFDPLADGRIGYARWRFSYASKMPDAEGKPVVFEGTSLFAFRGERITRYSEAFDRGVALVQLDFSADHIKRILQKTAAVQNQLPQAQGHLDRFSSV